MKVYKLYRNFKYSKEWNFTLVYDFKKPVESLIYWLALELIFFIIMSYTNYIHKGLIQNYVICVNIHCYYSQLHIS